MKERGKSCEKCGYSNEKILQIHHVDRDRNNNRAENLKLLCPNCHSEIHYIEKN
jgi:predicted HNH restriction endonuclease